MALQFAHGAIQWLAADVATTVYTVSGLAFQPQAIRFYGLGGGSASDQVSEIVHARRFIGFATSPSDRLSVATFSQDATSIAQTASAYRADCVAITHTLTVITGLLDLNSITSDGFTCIVDDQGVVDITVFWEAWGGDITVAATGMFIDPGATGNVDYTVTGFEAGDPGDQVVMFAGIANASSFHPSETESSLLVAAATGGGTTENIVVVGTSDAASATMDTDGYGRAGECIATIVSGGGTTLVIRATLTGFVTNGFRLNWAERVPSEARWIWLAIKGGKWRAGSYTIAGNSAGATATVASLPFTPIGVSLMGRMAAQDASDVATAQDRIGLGSGSSTSSRRAMGALDEDATASAEIDQTIQYDQVLAFPSTAGALLAAYDINAMNADGFQIIVDTAGGVANEWQGYLTFGNAAAAADDRVPPPWITLQAVHRASSW